MLRELVALGMIFGPAVGYLDQYRIMLKLSRANADENSTARIDTTEKKESKEDDKLRETKREKERGKKEGGFSKDVCGILLVASIFRVFFWFGKRFDSTLLYQALVIMTVQLLLLERCIEGPKKTQNPGSLQKRGLWRWPNFTDYLAFLSALALGLVTYYTLFGRDGWTVELLGAIGLSFEAAVPIPQALSNYSRRSVEGFSAMIAASWIFGDCFKTIYYITSGAPRQFIAAGLVQVSLDFVILGQFLLYSRQLRALFGIERKKRVD
ncbi:uncharacterized protein VTP21DRAFT_7109 [Calcarisporiella thermophila]|uniref:uncharacterized protein n=1 Tax=Calcarisporiella thermophila TaxID=911321 RepID=UPI0037445864